MLVTAPVIARLAARPRFWATRQIKAGEFGPVHYYGRAQKVELSYVEEELGIRFPPERLRAAGLRVSEAP
jgi:hypothetical protein